MALFFQSFPLRAVLSAALALPAQEPAKEITGSVVDEAGRGVAGVMVGYQWRVEGDRVFPDFRADTNGEGRFFLELPGGGAGQILILAIDRRGNRAGLAAVSRSETGPPVTIRLEPAGRVAGEVRCPKLGECPRRFEVCVYREPQKHQLMSFLSTTGKFWFLLPLGAYRLAFFADEFEETEWEVTLTRQKPEQELKALEVEPGVLARHYGKAPPAWKVTHAQGAAVGVRAADFPGRWVLVAFWRHDSAEAVRHCLPELCRIHAEFRDLAPRFAILAFHVGPGLDLEELHRKLGNTDFRSDGGGGAVKSRDLPIPILLDSTSFTSSNYGLVRLPRYMLLDPQGGVVRGGGPDLLAETLKGIRRELARAQELLARLRAEKDPRKAAGLVAKLAGEGGAAAAQAILEYGREVKDRQCLTAVLKALGALKGPGGCEFLCGERGLKAKEGPVREAAAEALAAAGDPAAVPALLALLGEKAPDPRVVGAACAALAKLAPRDGGVAAAIDRLCSCRSAPCRIRALETLVQLGLPAAAGRLRTALAGDENPQVRARAARLLGQAGDREAIPQLREAAGADPAAIVRKAAQEALTALGAGG